MRTDSKPWYKQFWPWFLIAIPGSSVVMGVIMLNLAIQGKPSMVQEEWYKDGLAINQRLDKQNRAKEAGIKAFFSFQPDDNIVILQLENRDPALDPQLSLALVHPTLEQRDIAVPLFRTPDNTYFAQLEYSPRGLYYAQLKSESGNWEIDSRLNFDNVLSDVELTD